MAAARDLTVALSGGGAKCAAQAGALQVLREAGLRPHALVGVSAGGLVAVLHSLGWSGGAIRDFIGSTHLLDLWDFDPSRRALLGLARFRAHLAAAVGDQTFDDLALPVTLVAVDLAAGREVYLDSGRLDEALAATMAMPGLLPPVVRAGRQLVDGGVVNPLPVDVARRGGRPVVAIDVAATPCLAGDALPPAPGPLLETHGPLGVVAHLGGRVGLLGMLEVVNQALLITTGRLRDYNLLAYPPDVLIRPVVDQVGLFASDLAGDAYQAGQAAAQIALPELRALVPAAV
ncbi:MAG: patatin-like phospholipase family protein [Anaerolineales bacterium]|nr:patatin-like phospholipase family protein [Anaerolineales bacterium]